MVITPGVSIRLYGRRWKRWLSSELRMAFLFVNEPVPVGHFDVDMPFMGTPEYYPAKYSKFDTVLAPGRYDLGGGFVVVRRIGISGVGQ